MSLPMTLLSDLLLLGMIALLLLPLLAVRPLIHRLDSRSERAGTVTEPKSPVDRPASSGERSVRHTSAPGDDPVWSP